MYYPIGWPKVLHLPDTNANVLKIAYNRDRVLIAVVTSNSLFIYYSKPCVLIVTWQRDHKAAEQYGENEEVEWKPDSSALAVTTSKGYILFYGLSTSPDQQPLYEQRDSTAPGLKRESAELFLKDSIPAFVLKLQQVVPIDGRATCTSCIRDEVMVATNRSHILRYRWDGTLNRDYCLDLRRIPFCTDQLSAKAVPVTEPNTYVTQIDYSPLLGGFAVVLNDGRGAFLTASSLKFDPNQVSGIWAPLEDVTATVINHRYRLIVFGRRNSSADVFSIDETHGGLQLSHSLQLSSRDFPGSPGYVRSLKWSPDGCCLALAWSGGALSLWSTFGSLLLCSLTWDYGPSHDPSKTLPLQVHALDWGMEGYHILLGCWDDSSHRLVQLSMVKSPLTANPCMSSREQLYLQGEDRIYINLQDSTPLRKVANSNADLNILSSKQWLILQVPSSYIAGNWPLRYVCLDNSTENLAVAGRAGFALYSFQSRRWKLFGNESQEKDFIVTGGMLWWRNQLILGCYNISADKDEIRIYPRDSARLDNTFCSSLQVSSQILLLSGLRDRLLVYTADCSIHLYDVEQRADSTSTSAFLSKAQEIDVSTIGLHPACLVAATLTTLNTEPSRYEARETESILLNVCGRVLLVHQETADPAEDNATKPWYTTPTVLASGVETLWVPLPGLGCRQKPHLTQALWLCCGAHGMRVWLPLYPRDGDKTHSFMSKRIMLPFQLQIYPLAVLFEEAILLGVETDSLFYPSGGQSGQRSWIKKIPACVLERNSQVYLHHIFRQLIRRNLGFHAWEIARGCTNLPYFAHSLELLLHEVLEEEATSKEPIPDALLPSVLEFIQEFPVYLKTIVQCARKTEVALWPYLFSAAANPRQLFQRCLEMKQWETAASYLIILQNMEPVTVSREYATVLLSAALENCCWDLAKDLVRFLRAIDPVEVESMCVRQNSASKISLPPPTPPVSPNEEDISFLIGSLHVHRSRSLSTASGPKTPLGEVQHRELTRASSDSKTPTSQREPKGGVIRKKSGPPTSESQVATVPKTKGSASDFQSAEQLFLDVILQRHARRLLTEGKLKDLGQMAAYLEYPLVTWLAKEKLRAARVEDFVWALRRVHSDFQWPLPAAPLSQATRRSSVMSRINGVDDKFQALEIDVTSAFNSLGHRVGDSGYISHSGNGNGDPNVAEGLVTVGSPWMSHKPATPNLLLQTVEAQLKPNFPGVEEGSVMNDVDEASVLGDDRPFDADSLHESTWSLHSIHTDAESWSAHYESAKGPAQSELQLRYLLQLFSEAECLDWMLVVAVVLKDAMAVLRVVSMARSLLTQSPSSSSSGNSSLETVIRVRDGLLALTHWSETDCYGYRPFMGVIHPQISVLTKLILPISHPPSVTAPQSPGVPIPSPEIPQLLERRPPSVSLPSPLGCLEEVEETETQAKTVETDSRDKTLPVAEAVHESSGCVVS